MSRTRSPTKHRWLALAAFTWAFTWAGWGPVLADYDSALAAYKGQDYAGAARELKPLAEQGHAGARTLLGILFISGRGVPQDYVRAHLWLNLAAAQGNPTALKARDELAAMMTTDQIAEAQRLAREQPAVVAAGAPPQQTARSGPEPGYPALPTDPPTADAASVSSESDQATEQPAGNPVDALFQGIARGVTGLVSGLAGSSARPAGTAGMGIRGVSAGMLAAARPDPAALQKLEGFAVSDEAAVAFAAEGSLSARDVAYLPEPEPIQPELQQRRLDGDHL